MKDSTYFVDIAPVKKINTYLLTDRFSHATCSFQLTMKLNKLSVQFEEELAMNRCLRENQTKWQERVGDLEEKLVKKDTVCILSVCVSVFVMSASVDLTKSKPRLLLFV